MITPDEISGRSEECGVTAPRIEKDYTTGWFLFELFSSSQLKDDFFLKGGNALRKGYFSNSRFTNDIDLGMENDIPADKLMDEVEKICTAVEQHAGIKFHLQDSTIKEKFGQFDPEDRWKVFAIRLPFQDFASGASHLTVTIRMDVTRLDKLVLEPQLRPLIHNYSDSSSIAGAEIRCLKLEELVANKMKCLLQREHVPDLYDFVFPFRVDPSIPLDKDEVRKAFLAKTIFSDNPGVVRKILETTPPDFFQTNWSTSLSAMKGHEIDHGTAHSYFTEELADMFKDYPALEGDPKVFFPSSVRHSIIKAGRSMMLLRMNYAGTERFIEPYSMKYKERRDGGASEYLYVYDRTGSKNNPGLKSFLPDKIGELEITDEHFDIRDECELELAKVGELPDNPYLYDPSKQRRTSRASGSVARMRSMTPTFQFECGVCGKKFSKKSMAATLGKHKGPYTGMTCYGRWGIYLGTKY